MNALDRCRARMFDLVHRVDTRVRMPLTHLEVVGPNKALGSQYMCTLPRSIHALIAHLGPIDPATTFIDIGCGKGAALLVASRYRFQRVVGVEFSPKLCEIARTNVRRYIGRLRCKDIRIVCQDATEFSFPTGPLIVYFFNPFQQPIMEKVLNNLAHSLSTQRRPVIAICDKIHPQETVQRVLQPDQIEQFMGFSIYRMGSTSA